ncbi:MAG: cache domain-containing protein, partial [Spirulina sp.]
MNPIEFWKKSLLVQIVGSFSLLSLAIVALVAYTAFNQARVAIGQSVFDRLTAAASLKEGELNRWLLDRRDTLISLSQLLEVKTRAQVLLTQKKSTPEYREALDILQTSLGGFIRDRSDYREIIILSKGGRVLMSTNPDNIGNYAPLDQNSEAIQGSASTALVSNFYQSSDTQQPTATFTTPILDETGKRLGMLAVHINLDRIDEIIRDKSGLGDTGETYLVANLGNNFTHRNAFVSAAGFGSAEFPDGVESEGILAAMEGVDDRGLYLNYRGTPVIGVYRWLEYQDVALLVEMEQEEAFAPARQLAYGIILVGSGLSALLAVGILMLGRRIVKPILAIAQTARSVEGKVKKGNFATLETAPILTKNEIGILARAFNQMTRQLQHSYEQLQEYSHTLEAKVTARTQE